MRIALFVWSFPSTSETFVLNQVTGLLDRGHEVFIFPTEIIRQGEDHIAIKQYNLADRTFYCTKEKSRIKRIAVSAAKFIKHFPRHPTQMLNAVNVFRYGLNVLNLSKLYEYSFWLEQQRNVFDIIFCHFGPCGKIALNLRQQGLISGKLVVVFHAMDLTTYIQTFGKNIYREMFEEGDIFMPITNYAKSKLINLGCPANKIIIHHMGVDCSRFILRQRSLKQNEPLNIVSIGRLVEKKGFEYGIRAIAKLIKLGYKLSYMIIGDGELRINLEQLARKLGIEANIHFTGWQTQEQILKILEGAHIMIAPSITAANGEEEGLPVVLMEALAVGLPVISTKHAGIPELIENGKNGFLIPERDSDALAEKISILYDNQKLRNEFSYKGRIKIEQDFDVEKLNDQIVKIFNSLLNH
ncbi:MAG: glycosyltransferase [Bacteroidales bacterium]|nr:glycosyltransferase [Bacteroidales bacterium]